MIKQSTDIQRLRKEYKDREKRLARSDCYSLFNPVYLYMIHEREGHLLRLLKAHDFSELRGKKVLELGCGSGGVLLDFLRYGALQTDLAGVDLLFDRLEIAKVKLPQALLACADGQALPYAASAFDLVIQFTAFSSILDMEIKRHMAYEMSRVLKPGGAIIWYDFWWNPSNKQTKGIRSKEICILFPKYKFDFRIITLAPPLTKILVPGFRSIAMFLEQMKLFNSHYLVWVQRSN